MGQKGASNGGTSDFYCGASGGGGSFVYTGAIGGTGLILSAGGGGGALSAAGGAISSNVSNASYSTSGYSIIDGGSYISLGGVNGNGGGFSNRSLLSGGPGAGWFSDYVPTYGSPNVTLGGHVLMVEFSQIPELMAVLAGEEHRVMQALIVTFGVGEAEVIRAVEPDITVETVMGKLVEEADPF